MKRNQSKRALRVTVALSLMVAISIVCGKDLAFSVGEFLRFSFENLPIILSGILFGPAAGALVGIVADLVGCVMVGYTINPIITLGAAVIGITAGISWRFMNKLHAPYLLRIVTSVGLSHILGSVLIKTFGLAAFYSLPIGILMLWRLLNYVIVGGVEGVLVFILMKNKLLTKQFSAGQASARKEQ